MNKSLFLKILLAFLVISCQDRTIKLTPNEFKSNVIVPKELFTKDSLTLVSLIKKEIKEHKGGYYSDSYNDSTQIMIDTIMYNPDYNKLIFFIIDKKENKLIYPKTLTKEDVDYLVKEGHTTIPYEGYSFTGKAYLGIRNKNTFMLKHFGLTTAYYNYIYNVRNRQKQLYFEEYSAVNEKGYEYNLDDKRFWDNKKWSFDGN